jgi:hypothetical protein
MRAANDRFTSGLTAGRASPRTLRRVTRDEPGTAQFVGASVTCSGVDIGPAKTGVGCFLMDSSTAARPQANLIGAQEQSKTEVRVLSGARQAERPPTAPRALAPQEPVATEPPATVLTGSAGQERAEPSTARPTAALTPG